MKINGIYNLFEAAKLEATPCALESELHGPKHWYDVAWSGLLLIAAGAEADPDVVLAFAALHDTRRMNDDHDPGHGVRATRLIPKLMDSVLSHLNARQLSILSEALSWHCAPAARRSQHTTIGVCWDADRLLLPRVGIKPRLDYLSWYKPNASLYRSYRDEPIPLADAIEIRSRDPECITLPELLELYHMVDDKITV